MSALHTLTEQYTDSEGEDEGRGAVNYSDPEEKQTKAEVLIPKVVTPKKSKRSKKIKRLVSYNDNEEMQEDITDEDEEEESSEEEAQEDDGENQQDGSDKDQYDSYVKKYGYSLPPEPTSKLNPKLQENISNLHRKIVDNGFDLNKYIQDKKEFRNPSIYDKLIQFCDINELGTNFPEEIYNPKIYETMNYEELAKAQKNEMDKLEKQKKENIKTTEAVKRKSKWDQQAPTTTTVSTVTSSTTSTTKTIIISSTGQLKKPKIWKWIFHFCFFFY